MRNAEPGDYDRIMAAVVAMLTYAKSAQMQFVDLDVVRAHVSECILTSRAVIVGDFVILFDIGQPWYSKEKYLIEDIILRVSRDHPEITVQHAIEALTPLALAHGCVAVAAGDTQAGKMAGHYHAQGFGTLGVQLFKEVPPWDTSERS